MNEEYIKAKQNQAGTKTENTDSKTQCDYRCTKEIFGEFGTPVLAQKPGVK